MTNITFGYLLDNIKPNTSNCPLDNIMKTPVIVYQITLWQTPVIVHQITLWQTPVVIHSIDQQTSNCLWHYKPSDNILTKLVSNYPLHSIMTSPVIVHQIALWQTSPVIVHQITLCTYIYKYCTWYVMESSRLCLITFVSCYTYIHDSPNVVSC